MYLDSPTSVIMDSISVSVSSAELNGGLIYSTGTSVTGMITLLNNHVSMV
jgi:predicted outer membrane repeat protein